jgi:hypothetical protein
MREGEVVQHVDGDLVSIGRLVRVDTGEVRILAHVDKKLGVILYAAAGEHQFFNVKELQPMA